MNFNGKGIKCPGCNSWITYVRIKTNELVCRKCGVVTNLDKLLVNADNNTTQAENCKPLGGK